MNTKEHVNRTLLEKEVLEQEKAEISELLTYTYGLCKEKTIPKIRDYYGSGWVGPGLTRIFFLNRPKIALNQY